MREIAPGFEPVLRCPLCEGRAFTPLERQPQIATCRDCQLRFRDPRPTPAAIAAHYARPFHYAPWLAEREGREAMWKRRLRRVRRRVRSGRLLDVGAGVGHFLALARAHFEILGTEVSAPAIALAGDRFAVRLLRGPLEEVAASGALEPASFDVVTLFHVLEHLADPRRTLELCRALLRPGGWIFVAVPNDGPVGLFAATHGARPVLARFLRRRLGETTYAESVPLPALALEGGADDELHLLHFEPSTLKAVLQRAGFRNVRLGADPFRPLTGLAAARSSAVRALYGAMESVGAACAHPALLASARRPG